MKLPFALARRFVAGETLGQAIPAVQGLNDKNNHETLDLLRERRWPADHYTIIPNNLMIK